MSISINNNTTAIIAHNNLQKASLAENRAVTRLSSGKASAFPGDRVADSAIATTLSSNIEMQKVALRATAQANQSVEIAYAATEEQLGIIGQLESITSQASSDNMSNDERKALNKQFDSLINTIDMISQQANYNGATLLNGEYTGSSHIQTESGKSTTIYDITSSDQYIIHGALAENPMIEKNSTLSVSNKVGKNKASGFINFTSNLKIGDQILINGRTFTAIAVTSADGEVKNNEFKLGCTLKETLENLTRVLNDSQFSEVTPATYSVDTIDKPLSSIDPKDIICNQGDINDDDNQLALMVTYNVAGEIGNDFIIGVRVSPPQDVGYTQSQGSLKFDRNLLEGDVVSVKGVEFVATSKIEQASRNEHNFLIGKSLGTTMKNLANKLNATNNQEVSEAKYSALSNGINVTYKIKGSDGNKFTLGAKTRALDAQNITEDQIKVVKEGNEAQRSFKITQTSTNLGTSKYYFTYEDVISINGIDFTCKKSPKSGSNEFEYNSDFNNIIKNLNTTVKNYVENNTADSKAQTLLYLQIESKLDKTDGIVKFYYNKPGDQSKGNDIKIKIDLSDGLKAKNVAIEKSGAPGTWEAADITAAGKLEGGESSITSEAGSKATAIIKFTSPADPPTGADPTASETYQVGDQIKLGNQMYRFFDKPGAGLFTNYIPVHFDSNLKGKDLLNNQLEKLTQAANEKNGDFNLQYDSSSTTLTIEAKDLGNEGNTIKFSLGNGKVKYGLDSIAAEVHAKNSIHTIESIVKGGDKTNPTDEYTKAGSHLGLNRQTIVTKVNINDSYFEKSNNKFITDTLDGGYGAYIGKKATIVVQYDSSQSSKTQNNYKNADVITLGNLKYTFKDSPANGAPALKMGEEVEIGKNIHETLRNLIKTVNEDTRDKGEANLKIYYNAENSLLRIINDVMDHEKNIAGEEVVISLDSTSKNIKTKIATNDNYAADTFATIEADDTKLTMSKIIPKNTLEGAQGAKNGHNTSNSNKININNTGTIVPENEIISYTLMNGSDLTSGQHATLAIDFSYNINSNNNFIDNDIINLNGEKFYFKKTSEDNSHNKISTQQSQTSVYFGNNIDDALNNLARVVNTSQGRASEAILQYDNKTHILYIKAKNAGAEGNNYKFNFGGTNVSYKLGDNVNFSSENKSYTINDVLKNIIDLNDDIGNLGTENISTSFSQNMKGKVSCLKGVFYEGSIFTDKSGSQHIKERNSVQFSIRVNGETYQTSKITLSGNSGYQHLGNKIAGGTKLIFQRVSGDYNEAGLVFNVKDDGVILKSTSNPQEIQQELNNLISNTDDTIDKGDISIGIGIKGREIKSYGLEKDRFISSGNIPNGSHLKNNIEFYDQIGLTKAQGTIIFKNNNFQNGDYLIINGTKFIADQDFTIGVDLNESVNNIISELNKSTDNNIAQAIYLHEKKSNTIIITYKQAGEIGNNFKISAKFVNRCSENYEDDPCAELTPDEANNMNGVKINDNNNNHKFQAEAKEVSLGENLSDIENKYVIMGQNKKSENNQLITSNLIGNISDLKISLVEGYSTNKKEGDFVPNALRFSMIINNNNAYTGEVYLSGGNRSAINGTLDGNGYNHFGNFLAGNSKIILNSIDNTHSIAITLDEKGLLLPDSLSEKSSVLRELSKIESSMNNGLKSIVINQKRNITNFDITKSLSTVLRGIKASNVYYQDSYFSNDKKVGAIKSFKVDNVASKISAEIDGKIYSQVLNLSKDEGGLGKEYDDINKIIKGGLDTTLILKVENDSQNSDRAIIINLQGVADIDIATEHTAKLLEEALNLCFKTGNGSGLRFQIGSRPTDIITLTFPEVTSKKLFVNDDGEYTKVDVLTKESALTANQIVHNAMNHLREERALIGANQAQFEAISNNLRTSIRALQSSRSVVEDADIAETSSEYALASMRVNAAASALAHSISSLRDMVMRLLQI